MKWLDNPEKIAVPLDTESKKIIKNDSIDLSENSRTILTKRYLRKNSDGLPEETIEEMFTRIAKAMAEPDKDYLDIKTSEIEFYNLLTTKKFFPNSPTFTGAGTPLGQLAACFVLPISDDMGKGPEGIFSTLRNAALIQQTGGGNGFSFSNLRSKGAYVSTSGGKASGPVGFLKIYDVAFGEVAQGGTRRGANMAVLRVDHPDIRDFIKCKSDEGSISNFNISIALTDTFMRAVEDDTTYELIDPHTKGVIDTPRAKEIFDLIVQYAYKNGEPGVLFIDEANKHNPVPHLYALEATNPCVTGDTLIYTKQGLKRAVDLALEGSAQQVVVDGRFNVDSFQDSSCVFPTGKKDVYTLTTKEGYQLRLTKNHKIKTSNGWVEASDLTKGDLLHILNRPGGFGISGSHEEGLVLGWVVGDGTINKIRTVLSFFGSEKKELAPVFADAVSKIVSASKFNETTRTYDVGITSIDSRDEARVSSSRLNLFMKEHGLFDNKLSVPKSVFEGSKEMQVGFLQALFTANGYVNNGGEKGCSVRLTSINYEMLQDVQRLLLNFGIAGSIYKNRRKAANRMLPDGKGGLKEYSCKAYHELCISKDNLGRFANEIGFFSEYKQINLLSYLDDLSRGPYKETFEASFESLELVGQEMVYDLTQPSTHSFIANGICVHNCGEQFLGGFENCCLGSINLAQHIDAEGILDWKELEESIKLSTRFLDNVVTANSYVESVPQLREAALKSRRIGLGFMGLSDAMYSMGIRYGSEKSYEFAAKITEFMRYHSMLTSIELAKERGSFPAIKGSIYDSADLKWEIPTPLKDYVYDFGRPVVNWEQVRTGIIEHGIRNAAQTTVAPTGTISTVAGVEGYGCEPVFALAYMRNVYQAAMDENGLTLTYTSPLFAQALDKCSLTEDQRKAIIDEVIEIGSCQNISILSDEIKNIFVVSSDIKPEEHVLMQASIQAFIDNSISKTCNFPASATTNDVAQVYRDSWKLGCKGLTIYVTGSRDEVVLETKATKDAKHSETPSEGVVSPTISSPIGRGYKLSGTSYKVFTPQGKAYVTVNKNDHGHPVEVFMNVGKAGSDIAALSEALGRALSGWLQASINPIQTVKEIVAQLIGIGGMKSVGFGKNRISSIPDAVAKVLSDEFELQVKINGNTQVSEKTETSKEEGPVEKAVQGIFANADMCPECGNYAFIKEEGCQKCYNCNHSVC